MLEDVLNNDPNSEDDVLVDDSIFEDTAATSLIDEDDEDGVDFDSYDDEPMDI